MPPEPPPDVTRDPILEGRDSLRLVKLRLALTLITVAILPVAAVAPLVRAVAEEARAAHHLRLDAQASQASSAIDAEIAAVVEAADGLAQDPRILAAVAGDAASADRAAAAARLGTALARRSGAVVGAAVLQGGETIVASWGAVPPVPDTPVAGTSPGSTADGASASLVVVSGSSGRGRALVVATISLPILLDWAMPETRIPGEAMYLVDATGDAVAAQRSAFDASALPGQVLDLATEAAHDSDGQHPLAIAGLDGWTVGIHAPIPLAELPVPALVTLGGLIIVLIGFTFWMARQILRPAAQLEASRSRLRELYESAREAAQRDSLTGLGNHRAFQEAVAAMVEGARRYGTGFALILFDIDEFKRVNDTRGHAVGDQLLADVGELIRSTIRLTDAGFRVGGDEFAILLPHTDAQGAVRLCNRLLARGLEERGAGMYRGPVSFSAGVTACPDFGTTRVELTAQADAALYRGKRAGRTVVTVFDPALDRGHVDEGMRAELSSAIGAVIESGTLTPAYQPIVDLATGHVLGYEGLIRVPRESAFPHTGALFDAAEAAGRVAELDRAALDVVLAGTAGIPDDVLISLNVSPRTLEGGELNATAFLAILRRFGVAPTRVILELTEREAVREPERLRETLSAVQRAGVRVAADDVGAGNAGLRLLSQVRFDIVKIDLSLVQGGSRGGEAGEAGTEQTLSVLASLVQMADRLGAMTIAEGVETADQLRTIRELGISAGQGYLLGRPAATHDLEWVDLDSLAPPADGPRPGRPGARLPSGVRADPSDPLRRRIEAGRRATGRPAAPSGPAPRGAP
jgi:diguanylate cyclase (GGDEF)-like protein